MMSDSINYKMPKTLTNYEVIQKYVDDFGHSDKHECTMDFADTEIINSQVLGGLLMFTHKLDKTKKIKAINLSEDIKRLFRIVNLEHLL